MEGLCLSGGGSNGDWQAGKLVSLHEHGGKWDVIVGTSVGALNGIMAACGLYFRLEDTWLNLRPYDILEERKNIRLGLNYLLHKTGLRKPLLGKFSNSPLYETLCRLVLDYRTECDYECSIVAVGDNSPNTYKRYKIPKGKRVTEKDVIYILASTAIPVVFDPVEADSTLYVDGGVYYNSPIFQLIEGYPVDYITAIACQPLESVKSKKPEDLLKMGAWAIDAVLRNSFLRDWEDYKKWNRVAEQAEETGCDITIKGKPVRYIKGDLYFPDHDLGNSLDFSNKKVRHNFVLGRRA